MGALFDLVTHFLVTIRAHRYFLLRIYHQAALGAFSGSFGNGSRARRADTLKLLFLISK